MLKWKMPEIFTDNENDTDSVRLMKMNMRRMAGMAALAMLVTVVLVFAMSAAWYSNIIHADSLTFTTDSWDFEFDGEITIVGGEGEALPGMSGLIPLTVENASDKPIAVSVTLSKELLNEEMKKRMFFYVDDQKQSNEETVYRNYVNMVDDYSYPITEGQKLTLSEEYQNAPELKWQWVYEMQGYYVQGTVVSDDSVEPVIEEYLRPVEYDSSKAIYDDETGKLKTIDGVSRMEFLGELTSSDGYAGNLMPKEDGTSISPIKGYYPISVDNDGYGVWLYLCTKDEIDAANIYDTELGLSENEAEKTLQIRIFLTGQNYVQKRISVGNVADIKDNLKNEGNYRLSFTDDTTLKENLVIESGRDVTLDLNDSTLYIGSDTSGFTVESGASLSLVNGEIAFTDGVKVPENLVKTVGGEVLLNNITSKGAYTAVRVQDNDAEGQDSRVRITNCTLETSDVALLIYGNGVESGRKTEVYVENSTITSTDYIGIMGNGSAQTDGGNWGTNITIVGSTITGKWGGIYHPQQKSTLYIENSTISGYTGIAVKAGTVNILDSQVSGTGEKQTPAFAASGYTDTGDAIYVETNYNCDVAINVSQKDMTKATAITSAHGYAIQVYEQTSPYVTISLTGGTYTSDVTDFVAEGYECVQLGESGEYEVHASAASTAMNGEEQTQ